MLTEQEKARLTEKWLLDVVLLSHPPETVYPPKIGCVYAFEMDDDTVKIGVTQDADRRKIEVAHAKSRDVLRACHTEYAPYSFMTRLERRCQAAFADRRVRGEYFNITFEEARAELDRHAPEVAEALREADRYLLDTIDFYFNEFLPEYERRTAEPAETSLFEEKKFSRAARNSAAREFEEFKKNPPSPKLDLKLLAEFLNLIDDPPLKEKLVREAVNLLLQRKFFPEKI